MNPKTKTQIRFVLSILASFLVAESGLAQETYWCFDEASGGYIMDENRPVGRDKSKPQAFFASRFPLTFDGQKAIVNFQGLRNEEFACVQASPNVFQCTGELQMLIFDQERKRFTLGQLKGHVGDSKESIVVRFGSCRVPEQR